VKIKVRIEPEQTPKEKQYGSWGDAMFLAALVSGATGLALKGYPVAQQMLFAAMCVFGVGQLVFHLLERKSRNPENMM
jgi:hypothetical protein